MGLLVNSLGMKVWCSHSNAPSTVNKYPSMQVLIGVGMLWAQGGHIPPFFIHWKEIGLPMSLGGRVLNLTPSQLIADVGVGEVLVYLDCCVIFVSTPSPLRSTSLSIPIHAGRSTLSLEYSQRWPFFGFIASILDIIWLIWKSELWTEVSWSRGYVTWLWIT